MKVEDDKKKRRRRRVGSAAGVRLSYCRCPLKRGELAKELVELSVG